MQPYPQLLSLAVFINSKKAGRGLGTRLNPCNAYLFELTSYQGRVQTEAISEPVQVEQESASTGLVDVFVPSLKRI